MSRRARVFSLTMIPALIEAVQETTPGWTPQAYASTARLAFLTFVVPAIVFLILAVIVERRAGARWLLVLWGVSITALLTYVARNYNHINTGRRGEILASMGGLRAMMIIVVFMYGVPFALSAVAVWRLGAGGRRPAWAQVVAGCCAWLVAVPIMALLMGFSEGLWAR